MSHDIENDDASARLERMRAIAKRCAKLLREAGPPVDHGDLLYDERGLPKQIVSLDGEEHKRESHDIQ